MGTLKGRTAFITGASQGIGAAISESLINSGCNICMHYYHSSSGPERIKEIAEKKGQKAVVIQADLTNENGVKDCITKATGHFPVFDILINNSGALVERRLLAEVDTRFWQKLLDLNMTSMMLVTRELLPYLNKQEGASIVNISSLAGRKGGHPGSLVYSTTKGAVLAWTRSLSSELGPFGIRVNAVAPGFIEGTRFHKEHTTRESAVETIKGIPLGRSGTPEDVARAVTFLASEYDGFITGETIDINGGIYCA
ncbi:SDR family oxidoreductase [Mariniphaga sediminis]|uniref:SDR family oxidoreductase n=1 Tax=Mariniphaga sediminis TaxID=1628158 RepID=A0A399D6V0_9BACT|nr:SDR family NAD(P)-dependent oxidoreductase [Mariniphaga sediminis]RIH67196.1 SDR family oxidoreductase [Mariniphaga sediminis]